MVPSLSSAASFSSVSCSAFSAPPSLSPSFSSYKDKNGNDTKSTLSIETPYLLTILVIKFEIVHSTTS